MTDPQQELDGEAPIFACENPGAPPVGRTELQLPLALVPLVLRPMPVGMPGELGRKVARILDEGTAPNTRSAYAGDLRYFWTWAKFELDEDPVYPVPVTLVVHFVADHLEGLTPATDQALVQAGIKARPGPHAVATVERRVAALSKAHQVLDVANPCAGPQVGELLRHARRRDSMAGRGPRKKTAATLDVLDALLATCGEDLAGVRDRALLLFGWATGGRRRSEVAAAQVEDLVPVEGGYVFRMRRSKTDQEGEGCELPVLGRAGQALAAWLQAAGVDSGPIFRRVRGQAVGGGLSDKSIALIVQRHAARAGFDRRQFGGHSLRSGFVTEGGRQGAALGDVMQLSRHRSAAVALGYHQAGAVLRNPAARMGG